MCDSLEVGGSGETDIIPEAHKKKRLKGHSSLPKDSTQSCFPVIFTSLPTPSAPPTWRQLQGHALGCQRRGQLQLAPNDVPRLHYYQSKAEEQDHFWLLL